MKINLKEFLKPTKGKGILFVILMAISSFYPASNGGIDLGFPLKFRGIFCATMPEGIIGGCHPTIFFPELIINIIIWYLAVCIITIIYSKVKK